VRAFHGAPVETYRHGLNNVLMASDAACVEANVDYAKSSGHLVRLDVEIPIAALNGQRQDGGPMGCRLESHDEAQRLGQQILARAASVRVLRDGLGGQGTSEATQLVTIAVLRSCTHMPEATIQRGR
jgi:hypothetical protein